MAGRLDVHSLEGREEAFISEGTKHTAFRISSNSRSTLLDERKT